jgi:acyl-CoA dehydrogenase
MSRPIFSDEHEAFRMSARRFFAERVVPHRERFESQGYVDRSVWEAAGELGFLCMTAPEEYGGAGVDRKFPAILLEEAAYAGQTGPGFWVHSDMASPYITRYGTEQQKRKWLPELIAGRTIMAIAMSEPGGGSDLAAIRTRAVLDGDDYVINGSKIFISNGYLADLLVVAARTGDEQRSKGISLFLVEAATKGFKRGKLLNKIGMKAQDTAELFFEDMRIPKDSLLGEEGQGFRYMMTELAWERTQIAIQAMAVIERAITDTYRYTNERQVFGKPVSAFQNTQFRLADFVMEATAGRLFVDDCIQKSAEGTLDAVTAAMAKAWVTELEGRVLDGCVQLHGGYGYIWDYPIARAFADARSQRIVGGTNEIMRQIVARSMSDIVDAYGL